MGVSIYFEEQGIDTATIDLELVMTFPGIAAQLQGTLHSGRVVEK